MATEAVELDKDAFMRLVTEKHLQVEGPSGGYLYTGVQGKNGWELYKTADNPWYLYQARRVATQANAAGGAITIDITVAAGQVARVLGMRVINSGTNGIGIITADEDNATHDVYAAIGSAAGTVAHLPASGHTGTTTAAPAGSYGLLVGPGTKLVSYQTAAGIQNDTLTVAVTLLLSTNTEPTWSVARSTNAGDVTLAASTISTANTMQLVPMP